jgi:hypothetical protein
MKKSIVASRPGVAWRLCPGILNEGRQAHYMRDGCWSCAPHWETVPVCPECGKMFRSLRYTGDPYGPGKREAVDAYCKTCRKRYPVTEQPTTEELIARLDAEAQARVARKIG